MFPCIVCPSCGMAIGQYYPLFTALRIDLQAKAMAARGYDINTADPAMVQAVDGVTAELGHILDILHMKRECCRTKLVSQELFYNVMG